MAQSMGARFEGERSQVIAARDALALQHGREAADRAMVSAAPTVRTMVDQAGSPEAAAKRAGFRDLGELAGAVAGHYAAQGAARDAPAASPIARWTEHVPDVPREAGLVPFDYGAGIEIAAALRRPPTEAPRYAEVVQRVRSGPSGAEGARRAIDLARDIGVGAAGASSAEADAAFRAAVEGRESASLPK